MCFFGKVYRLLEISRLSDLNGLFELFWAAFVCFTVLPARLKYFELFYRGILLLTGSHCPMVPTCAYAGL